GLAGEPSVRANAPRFFVYIGKSRPQDEKKAHTLGMFCEFAVLCVSVALPELRSVGRTQPFSAAVWAGRGGVAPESPWRWDVADKTGLRSVASAQIIRRRTSGCLVIGGW